MTKAVLIDVLGTLVYLDEPGPHLRAELAKRGIRVSEEEAGAAIGAEIGYYLAHHMDGATSDGLEDLRDRCADEIVRTLGLPAEHHAAVRAAMLDALVFTPFDDVVPALRELRDRGLTVVAASNWDCSLPDAMERVGLGELLDGAVSSAVAGVAKPDPAVFRAALRVAGCEPEEALFVGDSLENDVRGAEAVGMRGVLLLRDGTPPAGAEAIRSLRDLPALT
jgi:putative hydrolase of the HAD superfamily